MKVRWREDAYKRAIAMYGIELMAPTIHAFLAQVPCASQSAPDSAMPKACGKDKLAPLLPV